MFDEYDSIDHFDKNWKLFCKLTESVAPRLNLEQTAWNQDDHWYTCEIDCENIAFDFTQRSISVWLSDKIYWASNAKGFIRFVFPREFRKNFLAFINKPTNNQPKVQQK